MQGKSEQALLQREARIGFDYNTKTRDRTRGAVSGQVPFIEADWSAGGGISTGGGRRRRQAKMDWKTKRGCRFFCKIGCRACDRRSTETCGRSLIT
ncbi:hypothetical protein MA16_Dca006205 [Dendrobium catenatum]|uniref:Uncharacterized protein n=1 Tax=Dendrobium catenatum TaxID=906689 RepID=A0A2I0X4T7_9ASPA|nr:hypothetical protein MA16_Dca006205 [Dendrobium catenatum]